MENKKVKCNRCDAENTNTAKYCCECGYELPKSTVEIENQQMISKNIPKSDLKKKTTTIVGLFVGIIVAVFVQQLFFKTPTFDEMLVKTASEINKTCPFMVDQYTCLDNVLALPNNTIQYNYTLVNIEQSEVNYDTVKKYIESSVIENVKSNPDLKIYREHKTTMIYNYQDKNGVFVLKIPVTPDMYK